MRLTDIQLCKVSPWWTGIEGSVDHIAVDAWLSVEGMTGSARHKGTHGNGVGIGIHRVQY